MRGRDDRSEGLFSYVRLEERIPADHPLRPLRALTDEALGRDEHRQARLANAHMRDMSHRSPGTASCRPKIR